MAVEIFTTSQRDFILLGLGNYLKETVNKGDLTTMIFGVVILVFVIVVLDQLVGSHY